MRDYFRKKTWFITTLMFVIAFSLSFAIVYYDFGSKQNIKISNAGASSNVSGYAWSSNIGWVSLNCTNDSSCGSHDYGVNVDLATGNFSGYAWSSNIGWIDFGPTSGYPEAPNTAAYYDSATGAVTGWAKSLSLGNNGWIKMSGSWTNGVSINSTTGDFSGYAWNGNATSDTQPGIGWLSFNCANDSSCGASNYKVVAGISSAPTITDLTAPNWTFSQSGQYGALKAKLGWVFNSSVGSSESAYEVIVNTSNSISSPVFDSGKCLGYNNPTNKCKIDIGVDQFPIDSAITLNYNTPYYWWVKVWDNNDESSDLIQYNTAQDTPTEANDGSPFTFTSYKHEMPDVDFYRFPLSPNEDEEVTFTDNSHIYSSAAPTTAIDCTEALCDWQWSLTGSGTISDETASTTTIIFNSSSSATVTLKVTDNEGYYTSVSKIININTPLPNWKEVK